MIRETFDDDERERVVRRLGGLNGSVRAEDVEALNRGCLLVVELLSDQQWHRGPEFDDLPIQDPKRRLRDLRFHGFEIVQERVVDAMTWAYRWTGIVKQYEPPPFRQYYLSAEWRTLAVEIAGRDGWRCVNCESNRNLQCHHLTYARFGCEDFDDLVTLCLDCHRAVHRFATKKGRPRRSDWKPGFPAYDDLQGLTTVPPPTSTEMRETGYVQRSLLDPV